MGIKSQKSPSHRESAIVAIAFVGLAGFLLVDEFMSAGAGPPRQIVFAMCIILVAAGGLAALAAYAPILFDKRAPNGGKRALRLLRDGLILICTLVLGWMELTFALNPVTQGVSANIADVWVGRALFGIPALLLWAVTILVAIGAVRTILGRDE